MTISFSNNIPHQEVSGWTHQQNFKHCNKQR